MSPCPGKCFAVAKIFFDCNPFVKLIPLSETLILLSPKDLFPIIGFLELVLISMTGAKFI